MVLKKIPRDFNPQFEAVGCYCEYKNTILLLHRQDHKPQGNTWNIPGGKIDNNETPLKAIMREVYEESGILLKPEELEPIKSYFIRYTDCDYIYHTFKTKINKNPKVTIQPKEAKAFKWVTVKEALKLNLIEDEDYCMIDAYKNI
jgi:8-oxo-dGTP pyrophosphatase MutT (NUDIX family)